MSRQTDGEKPKRKQSAAQLANLTGGSRKGVPNKTTRLAKDAIAEAFDRLGGADRLVAWAQEDPDNEKVFFTQLLPKLIPVQTEITGKDGGDIRLNQVNEDASAVRSRLVAGLAAAGVGAPHIRTVQ